MVISARTAIVVLSVTVLSGCLGSSDVQLIGSNDAAFPLPDGTALYLYMPVAGLTDRQKSVLTAAELDVLRAAGTVPIDRASGGHQPRNGASFEPYVLRRSGHCYRLQGTDDEIGYVAFARAYDAVHIATITDGEVGCLEAAGKGGHDVGIVEVTPESILPFDTDDLQMEQWAAGLDRRQQAGYDISVDASGEFRFRSVTSYLAYVRSLRGQLVHAHDIVRWLAEPPSPRQVAAARLVVLADRRLRDRDVSDAGQR